jgi:hypothetical protein
MARFLLIAGGADIDKRVGNPKFAPVMFDRYMAWIGGLRQSGQLQSALKLQDQTGRRLTVRGGEVLDGPFIESKEAVGGVFLIEAESVDAATEIARACPMLDLQNGYMEVRVVDEVPAARS